MYEHRHESLNPPYLCPECGGDAEVCAELGSHTWVTCPGCGADMRPQWDRCQDCGAAITGGPDDV